MEHDTGHDCDAILVTCIDFRLQKFIEDWARKNLHPEGKYDRVAIAGGVQDVDYVLKQVNTSIRLHNINTVLLVNHEECGAYPAGTTKTVHRQAIITTAVRIFEAYRDPKTQKSLRTLTIRGYYLHLDGTFESVYDFTYEEGQTREK